MERVLHSSLPLEFIPLNVYDLFLRLRSLSVPRGPRVKAQALLRHWLSWRVRSCHGSGLGLGRLSPSVLGVGEVTEGWPFHSFPPQQVGGEVSFQTPLLHLCLGWHTSTERFAFRSLLRHKKKLLHPTQRQSTARNRAVFPRSFAASQGAGMRRQISFDSALGYATVLTRLK